MAVEAEPAPDDPVERAHEEVGQVVDAGLMLLEAAEDPVTVRPGEARELVERAAGAAVRVADEIDVVAERVADALRAVVQLGRQRLHVEVPAATLRDLVDVQRERAAGDDVVLVIRGTSAGR